MSSGLKPALPPELRRAAIALVREQGLSPRDAAEQLSLSFNTVKSWLAREKKRDLSVQQPTPIAIVEVGREPEEPIELDSLAEKQEFFQEKMSDAAVRLAQHVSTLEGDQLVKQADKIAKGAVTARASLKLDKGDFNPVIQLAVLMQSPARAAARSEQLPSVTRPRELVAVESDASANNITHTLHCRNALARDLSGIAD